MFESTMKNLCLRIAKWKASNKKNIAFSLNTLECKSAARHSAACILWEPKQPWPHWNHRKHLGAEIEGGEKHSDKSVINLYCFGKTRGADENKLGRDTPLLRLSFTFFIHL